MAFYLSDESVFGEVDRFCNGVASFFGKDFFGGEFEA